jgi:hypothetical protein
MTITFTRATKKALKARIALEGPSGSGKTWTALVTARALVGPTGRIALLDTERRSASLYADQFEFDTAPIEDNYHPQRLIDAIAAAGAAGYDALIIDSWSHFWMGAGGMLEEVDKAAKRSGGGNTFAGWKELRPLERKMVDAILAFPGHVITTLRTKSEWVVEENERGKKVPKKIGLKAEQREGLEFEFTVVGAMDAENTLVVSKSRCPALSGAVVSRPDDTFGRTLLDWLDDGESAGVTAVQLRDEILAAQPATAEEYRVYYNRAKADGVLGTAIVDEHGDTTTLGDWIIARGKATAPTPPPSAAPPARPVDQAPAPAADEDLWEGDDAHEPTGEPAQEPAAAPTPSGPRESQHRRMHALWARLGKGGDEHRDERLAITSRVIGRQITTSSDMSPAEADTLLEYLENREKTAPRQGRPAARQRRAPSDPSAAAPATREQRQQIVAKLNDLGYDNAQKLAYCNETIAPETVKSAAELTEFQAAQILGRLAGGGA